MDLYYILGVFSITWGLQGAMCNIYSDLKAHIKKQSDPQGRPVLRPSTAVNVSVDMAVSRIVHLDMSKQNLQTSVWMRQQWKDESIPWKPEDYHNITSVHVSPSDIWVPDTVIYNAEVQNLYNEEIKLYDVIAFSDGSVYWYYPLQVTSTCDLNVTYFPFDTQYCKFEISTWTYDGYEVHVQNMTSAADLSSIVPHGLWTVESSPIIPWEKWYGVGPEAVPYYGIIITLELKRIPLYFIQTICFPTLLMLTLLLFGLLIPSESEGKVTLGITLFLSQIVLALIVTEHTPVQSRDIPLMSKFMMVVLIDMVLFLVINTIILGVHNKGLESLHLPQILSSLLLNPAVMMCMFPMRCMEDWQDTRREKKLLAKNSATLTRLRRESTLPVSPQEHCYDVEGPQYTQDFHEFTVQTQEPKQVHFKNGGSVPPNSENTCITETSIVAEKNSCFSQPHRCDKGQDIYRNLMEKSEYHRLAIILNRLANAMIALFTLSIMIWICLLAFCEPDIVNRQSSCGEIIYAPW